MVQGQGARVGVPAIQNCRYFSFVTQAAARTFALRLAELGDEFERGFHNLLQLHSKHGCLRVATNRGGTDRFNSIQLNSTQFKARATRGGTVQSTYSELTDSSSLMRRIVSASNPATLNWRIRRQALPLSESGIVSVTTSSSNTDFEIRSIAAPDNTGCVM